MKRVAMYPGCSLEGTAAGYRVSVDLALKELGCACEELRDWNCCGATSAHAMDHALYLGLAARNLALAQEQDYKEVLAPCAACYHRLASANQELTADGDLLKSLNSEAALTYDGEVKIRNVLDLLANVIGCQRISERVSKPLNGLKVVCYYGCLNTRVPRMKSFDDVAYPMSMDRIVEALGATAMDWSYKTDCCGGSLFVTAESTVSRLVGGILRDADVRGADCIAVACPMCHNNLDTKQAGFRAQHGITRPLPVLFVTQLMGLAFGVPSDALRIDDAFVPVDSLEVLA